MMKTAFLIDGEAWMAGVVGIVRSDLPDLTNRQMAILLTVALAPEQHTVRGLAARLGVSKPVISRALDKLTTLGFMRRKRDPKDRRLIFVVMEPRGQAFLEQFDRMIGSMRA